MVTTSSEIAVVGGGPAGSVMAILLDKLGFDVALIDGRDPKTAVPADSRAFAIVRGGWRVLEAAGVAEGLRGEAQIITGMEAHDTAGGTRERGSALFSPDDLPEDDHTPGLGFLVEVDKLYGAVDAALGAAPSIRRLAPVRYEDHQVSPDGVEIRFDDGDTHETSLLVAADGVGSSVRAAAGLKDQGWDYGQSVFAVTVQLEEDHRGLARQWFLPEGPFAMLPLTGNRGNVAWFRTRGAAEALSRMDKDAIEAELNGRFAQWVGLMTLLRDPLAYPLRLNYSEEMVSDRLALVGDAARRIHPSTGQGFNLGLKDCAALAEVLHDGQSCGLPVSDGATLERYQEWRRFDGIGTALAMDAMNRTYSNDHSVLKPFRRMALDMSRRLGPLRSVLTRQASAEQSGLPRLTRGEALGDIRFG